MFVQFHFSLTDRDGATSTESTLWSKSTDINLDAIRRYLYASHDVTGKNGVFVELRFNTFEEIQHFTDWLGTLTPQNLNNHALRLTFVRIGTPEPEPEPEESQDLHRHRAMYRDARTAFVQFADDNNIDFNRIVDIVDVMYQQGNFHSDTDHVLNLRRRIFVLKSIEHCLTLLQHTVQANPVKALNLAIELADGVLKLAYGIKSPLIQSIINDHAPGETLAMKALFGIGIVPADLAAPYYEMLDLCLQLIQPVYDVTKLHQTIRSLVYTHEKFNGANAAASYAALRFALAEMTKDTSRIPTRNDVLAEYSYHHADRDYAGHYADLLEHLGTYWTYVQLRDHDWIPEQIVAAFAKLGESDNLTDKAAFLVRKMPWMLEVGLDKSERVLNDVVLSEIRHALLNKDQVPVLDEKDEMNGLTPAEFRLYRALKSYGVPEEDAYGAAMTQASVGRKESEEYLGELSRKYNIPLKDILNDLD